MAYTGPYHVERSVRRNEGSHTYVTCYSIERSGEGVMVRGDDVVFMNHLCDLLNDDEHGRPNGHLPSAYGQPNNSRSRS
jgi:hypothetical protein